VESVLKDVAYAVRTLRKNPGFTVTALLTLALGIGASTAIFSVVNAVLLRPLPYANADRLVIVTSDMRNRDVKDFPIAPGDQKDMVDQLTQFESLGGVLTFRQPLVGDDNVAEQVKSGIVTANFFKVLGARIVAGRDFIEADGTAPAAPPAGVIPPAGAAPPPPPPLLSAVISYDFWQRRFGGDQRAIGRTVTLGGGARAQIVGVLGPEVELLFPPRMNVTRNPDILTVARINFDGASRVNVIFRLIGRLKPGASVQGAQTQLDALGADLREHFPIKKTAGVYFRAEPMHAYLSAEVRPAVLALMGAVAFVLLIACANVANLILVRTSRRERELAVRAALGGGRTRLIRQMLAESLVLAGAGAVLGLALAQLGIKLLLAIGPASLPVVGRVSLDPTVLGFTALAGLVAAALFGVVPALRASRPDLIGVLRASGRNSELGGGRLLRNGVVVAEVALAFVLLVGSGLMIRSFAKLIAVDPGFDPKGVLTFTAPNPRARTPADRQAFSNALRDKLAALPGVTSVTAAGPLPLDGTEQNMRWGTESAVTDPSAFRQADVRTVIPGYFDAMRTRLVEGRDFTAADNVPETHAIIIDRVLAAKAFPGEHAVGKRIFVRFRSNEPEWMDVIGVVEHQRHATLAEEGREAAYVTDGSVGFGGAARWAVRTSGDPAALSSSVRAAVASIDPLVPVGEVVPMSEYVDRSRAPTKFALILIGIFGAVAVVLCSVGLYGVLSTVVRQRTAEIGVRMALGAPTANIFALVIGQGLRLTGAGLLVGIIAAVALTRVMRSMLVGVSPGDPATFAVMAVVFAGVAAVSCWMPARRAARLDPAIALRED